MIDFAPYDDHGAMAVLSRLDAHDLIEVQLTCGRDVTHLALFADWRALEPARLLSLVLRDPFRGGVPFALLGLTGAGAGGVAQAALLARDHRRHRRALVATARLVRDGIADFCASAGLRRIEARAWAGHPGASRFLTACGFTLEASLPGFGTAGGEVFRQFAWIAPEAGRTADHTADQTEGD